MQQINIGDYIIGTKDIWEIIDVRKDGLITVYDIKKVNQPADFLEVFDDSTSSLQEAATTQTTSGLTIGHLRHLGQVVPKDSEKVIKVLFGD